MIPNSENGIVFIPPADRAWCDPLITSAVNSGFTITKYYDPCGRFEVDGCPMNLVKLYAHPHAFFVKYTGVSRGGKEEYELFFPRVVVDQRRQLFQ